MANDDFSSDEFPDIELHIPDGLTGPVDDGVPYMAGYTIYTDSVGMHPTRWVILQNEKTEAGKQRVLVKFVEEDEEAYLLTRDNADLVVYWDTEKGWVDENKNAGLDVKGVGAITMNFLRTDKEEWLMDEGPDPLSDFEGFYVITKDDGTQPVLYEVTIKGEYPDEGSKIGNYTVVYSDGTIKTIDWQPGGAGWIERGAGKTPHSLSIGILIEKHFGQKEN